MQGDKNNLFTGYFTEYQGTAEETGINTSIPSKPLGNLVCIPCDHIFYSDVFKLTLVRRSLVVLYKIVTVIIDNLTQRL